MGNTKLLRDAGYTNTFANFFLVTAKLGLRLVNWQLWQFMGKRTFGVGKSVMMLTGGRLVFSGQGPATSIAWDMARKWNTSWRAASAASFIINTLNFQSARFILN
jgi:hypothetical protein